MVLAAGFVDGPAVYALWTAALTLQVITPYLGVAPQFDLNAEHFVERHGLLVIVALGESVIAIGASVDADHLDAATSGAVVLALALPAALWWSYFSGDTAAETALATAEPGARALLAIRAYFYAHIPMLLGVMFAAAGLHAAVAHPTDRLSASSALVLFGGLSLFCLGNAEFRRVLAIGSAGRRVVMGLVVAAAVPFAWVVPAWLHMAIAAGLMVGLLAARPSTRRDQSGRVHTERPSSLQ
jgi:low temperature requirement protein LtrA